MKNWIKENLQVTNQWDFEKNGTIHPSEISRGSDKKVWWKCEKGHSWEATVLSRINLNSGCPYCSGRRATTENNLEKHFPEILKQWNYNKNSCNPSEICPKSNERVWWKCEKGHEWETSISNRTNGGTLCPYCQGLLATHENSLGYLYPNICLELHPTKNIDIDVYKLTPKTHKKLWWKCRKGHEWETKVSTRTHLDSGCPICNHQSSKLERRVFCELKSIFKDVFWRDRSIGKELDVFIKSLNIGIEIDGYMFHKSIEKDIEKNELAKSNGIRLIRIRQKPLKLISKDDFGFNKRTNYHKIVWKLVKIISNIIGTKIKYDITEWINDKEYRELYF